MKFPKALPSVRKFLSRFAPQIRQQGWLISGSLVALLIETWLRLLDPWPLKFIFDSLIVTGFNTNAIELPFWRGQSSFFILAILALFIIAIALLRAILAYFSSVAMAYATSHITIEIRANLYRHLQNLPLSFHSKVRSGDLIARVTYDIERMREVSVNAFLPLMTNILTLTGMLGVMMWMNAELATIALLILPIFLVCANRLSKKIRRVAKIQSQREGEMAATAAEAMGAIRIVQAFSLQGLLEQMFGTHNQKSLKEGAKALNLAAELERTIEVLVAIATALIIWRGVQLIYEKAITPGDLLVFTTYLKTAFKPTRQLAKYTGQIAKAAASGERIIELLDTKSEIRDVRNAIAAPSFRGKVQFDRVNFAYELDRPILKNLSFTVTPGQRVALVGSSGSGKSSLVSLLLRLYEPTTGKILFDDRDIRDYTLDSLRQQISIVPQDSGLFAVSIRENIAYGCLGVTQAEIEKASRLANAHNFIMALPQGYDTILGERGATLSGGQRQRIAIARAAVRRSPIVILDEPTTGLDNENEQAVSEALERLTQERTTFLISHNLRAIEQTDLIFYLENGQLLERGTHQELMRLGSRYAAMYAIESAIK
jgi:ATP-binding cassette, subfamily B, bacterial